MKNSKKSDFGDEWREITKNDMLWSLSRESEKVFSIKNDKIIEDIKIARNCEEKYRRELAEHSKLASSEVNQFYKFLKTGGLTKEWLDYKG